MSCQLTFREMTIDDVPKLKLDEDWMRDRFITYFKANTGPAFVIEERGKALAAFGALFEWKWGGPCEVWFNLIENRRTFDIVRMFKRLIVGLAGKYEVTRMQAIIKCDSKKNMRWMKFLGFENETPNGMKKKLPDGRDAYLFARCF